MVKNIFTSNNYDKRSLRQTIQIPISCGTSTVYCFQNEETEVATNDSMYKQPISIYRYKNITFYFYSADNSQQIC